MRTTLLILLLAVTAAVSNSTIPKRAPAKKASAKPVVAAPKRAAKVDRSRLTLLYTASADGQIRSCNCTKFRFGGYGRQLTLLKSIRSQDKNTVLIEGGDICGGSGFQAALKADVAAKALRALGYGVMVPGDADINNPGKRFISRFDPKSTPIVCANLLAQSEKKTEFKQSIIIKTSSGLRVGIVGLIDPSLFDLFASKSMSASIKDPLAVLQPLVKKVRANSDLVVLVYHAGPEKVEALSKVKGVDLILQTHHSGHLYFPQKDKNIVDAPVAKKGSAWVASSETKTNWSLGRIDLELTKSCTIRSVKHTLIYLDRRYDEDPQVVKIYDDYNVKVREAVLNSSVALKKSVEQLLLKRGLNLVEMRKRLRQSPFVTSEKCKDCHAKAYEMWASSRHAKAMSTLEQRHQDYDPECVSCHATGVIASNGYVNRKETPQLVNVQCEACHGQASEHVKAPEKGWGKTGEDTCRSCHTDDRTPDFNFEESWAKITH